MMVVDYPFPYVVLYMVLGTFWGWYAQSVFYKLKHIYQITHLVELPSLALNCMLFPLGMLFKHFIYVTSDVSYEDDLKKVKISIILDPLVPSLRPRTFSKTWGNE